MRKLIVLVVILNMSLLPFWGCHWAGRTAGKVEKGARIAADKVEEGAENTAHRFEKMERDFQKGYEAGRH